MSHPTAGPFPHELGELPALKQVCDEHQVYARHGDVYDAFNYEGNRDASSLGDAIVVELLNRFPSEVELQLGQVLPPECLAGLREVDNVRPLLAAPAWIEGLLQRKCPDPQQTKSVKRIWDDLADQFLQLKFVRDRDKWYQLNDLADQLQWALKFSKGASLRTLSQLMTWWNKVTGGRDQSFFPHAMAEQAFKNRTAKYIVYGHTHRHEIVPLDSSFNDRGQFDQMYINSGTWRRVHEQAKWNVEEREFMGYYVMTYLAFFKGDERGGRTFESWSGALGA